MKQSIRKLLCALLVIGMLMSSSMMAFGATTGDVNSDGIVNSTDALAILKYTVGKTPSKFDKGVADMNGDGNVNSTDALAVLKITVGIGNSSELSKADIVKLYNDGLSKVSEQLTCTLTISTDISGSVNDFLMNGEKNPMLESLLENSLNSDYEDEKYRFFNGKTTDGQKANDILSSISLTTSRVKSASAVKQGDGYKLTVQLVEETQDLDELLPSMIEFDYCEVTYPERTIIAITDSKGRITRIDYYADGNMKASGQVNDSSTYLDVSMTEKSTYTFSY